MAAEFSKGRNTKPTEDISSNRKHLGILQRPPHRRSAEELRRLVTAFRDLAFFKELEPQLRTQICKHLKYEQLQVDQFVFREGEPGDKFYIILSGSVGIYVRDVSAQDLEQDEALREAELAEEAAKVKERQKIEHANGADDEEKTEKDKAGVANGTVLQTDNDIDLSKVKIKRRLCIVESAADIKVDLTPVVSRNVSIDSPATLRVKCANIQRVTSTLMHFNRSSQAMAALARDSFRDSFTGSTGWSLARDSFTGSTGRNSTDVSESGFMRSSLLRATIRSTMWPKRGTSFHLHACLATLCESPGGDGDEHMWLRSDTATSFTNHSREKRSTLRRVSEAGSILDIGNAGPNNSITRASTMGRQRTLASLKTSASICSGKSSIATLMETLSSSSDSSSDTSEEGQTHASFAAVEGAEDSDTGSASSTSHFGSGSSSEEESPTDEKRQSQDFDKRRSSAGFNPEQVWPTSPSTGSEPPSPSSVHSPGKRSFLRRQSSRFQRRQSAPVKLIEVASLAQGGCFGEVALRNDQPRTATVKTKENCAFATLTREDFQTILQNTFDRQQQERLAFLKAQPLLSGLTEQSMNKLSTLVQIRTITRNEAVCKHGSPMIQVYLVKDGDFHVEAPVKGWQSNGSAEPVETDVTSSKSRPFTSQQFVTIATLMPTTMFGLHGYLRGERRHRFRIICRSVVGTVYSMLAKELMHFLSRDQRARLMQGSQVQDHFYRNRVAVMSRLVAGNSQTARGAPNNDASLTKEKHCAHGAWGADSIYSIPGRLNRIGQAFAKTSDANLGFKSDNSNVNAATAAETGERRLGDADPALPLSPCDATEGKKKMMIKPLWHMEQDPKPVVSRRASSLNCDGDDEPVKPVILAAPADAVHKMADPTSAVLELPLIFRGAVLHWEGRGRQLEDKRRHGQNGNCSLSPCGSGRGASKTKSTSHSRSKSKSNGPSRSCSRSGSRSRSKPLADQPFQENVSEDWLSPSGRSTRQPTPELPSCPTQVNSNAVEAISETAWSSLVCHLPDRAAKMVRCRRPTGLPPGWAALIPPASCSSSKVQLEGTCFASREGPVCDDVYGVFSQVLTKLVEPTREGKSEMISPCRPPPRQTNTVELESIYQKRCRLTNTVELESIHQMRPFQSVCAPPRPSRILLPPCIWEM